MKIDNCNKIIHVSENNAGFTSLARPAYFKSWILANKPVNLLKINFIGVNSIGHDKKTNKIFFVSGYTPERGLFIDKY